MQNSIRRNNLIHIQYNVRNHAPYLVKKQSVENTISVHNLQLVVAVHMGLFYDVGVDDE